MSAPWVTVGKSYERQDHGLTWRVLLKRFQCVVRAGQGEATGGGKKWRKDKLICLN